ncbi:glycosyltransferase family 2 protein [Bradyrhizobium liaoningense]|uniref:glycosyltransferase family 2 protein n=1 Tax=Bradyrhizobium liaoningense TaxID=43992 RepID=UPI001BA88544|nr:glycosyltransferase family 2 protein [Bradyrhizobium liaoningense]MBR0738833.1 glycosyltransferase family 2 protein [Bradyrhizobium liaoningense]MBR0904245.1 glycosyltransferase family 2 protein [Bradyrhizobium liaoningense]
MNEAIRPGADNLPQAQEGPELSVIVPTFNERDNVMVLYRRLEATLVNVAWEVVFVDDNSPDGTWDVVRALAQRDSRVRCVRRIGRRGLSGACIEGILASSAPFVAVIDADLQHDETQLPKMLLLLASDQADLVVGSRYIEGYKSEGFNKQRAGASALATEFARKMLRVEIADPMSGFFMLRRDHFEQLAPKLSVHGFKILLDVVATANGTLRAVEIPYTFGARQHGESKLDSMVALDFLGLVLAKLSNDIVSLRFILFAMVGGIGLVVHLTTLFIGLQLFKAPFAEAQAAGAIVAMTSNFILNNFLTYRDQRLKGFALLRGLIAFYIVCSVGLLANVGVAFSVYDQEPIWWLAGMAGALMGVVWNYAMSGLFVWRKK